jgi:hypothetical protein
VSVQVSKLVWAYGPRVEGPRMLLLALAEHANDEGVAWPGLELLAAEITKDVRTVQRRMAWLERAGWLKVQRRSVKAVRGEERRGNTYVINLFKLRGQETPNGQGSSTAAGASQGHRSGAVETARRDDKTVDLRRQNEGLEMTKSTPRDDISCAPLMNHQEPPWNHHEKYNHPLPPPSSAALLKTAGLEAKGKSADQGQRPEATASARATATTSSPGAPGVSTESVGSAGLSSGPGFRVGDRVVEFAPSLRGRRVERELDGVDAALRDETTAVLARCGVAPEISTRRERAAVTAALRMRCDRERCCVSDAGRFAVAMWEQYLAAAGSGVLYVVVGVRKFFSEGLWLDSARWSYDRERVRQRSGAAIGTRQHADARREIAKLDEDRERWERERRSGMN